MRIIVNLIFAFLFLPSLSFAQVNLTASELLDRSMDYHDPDRRMMQEKVFLTLNEPRKNGENRITELCFDPGTDFFEMKRNSGDTQMMMSIQSGIPKFELNGSSVISDEDKAKHKLNAARVVLMRNYYHYLWYLPMKLEDPGTIIDPQVEEADFFGTKSLRIRVTYDPEVGEDIWYFYFDPNTYALVGYKFYHDEAINDGEYILLDGETSFKNVRIPKTRKWYKHQEDEYLGMDVLEEILIK